jgi:hypothetical protein
MIIKQHHTMEDYDYFDPNYNDYNSINSELSSVLNARKADKNYEEIYIRVEGKKKRLVIRSYGTPLRGFIRNAVDGSHYNINVGEMAEETLFKVIVSDGRNGRKEPLMLYYDTPEQYERHRRTVVVPETKEKWYKRQLKYV